MTVVAPGKGRAIVEQTGKGLRITIPAKTNAFATLLLAFWLIAWTAGGVMTFSDFASARNAGAGGTMLAIGWLGVWTLGGAWVAGALLWHVAGKEIIDLNAMTLKRRKQIPVVGRSKEFAVSSVTNLRPAPAVPSSLWVVQQQTTWILGFSDGSITFDYGRDTHHLASDLDEADAKYVIGEMRKRVKSLGS